MRGLIAFLALLGVSAAADSGGPITRRDFYVSGDPGIQLFVREITSKSLKEGSAVKPVLLIHGARVPGLASFDLDVPGGSLAGDLALRGFTVYVMDVRGYGASTRPVEMDQPPDAHTPLVRSDQAARDIGAVVNWIRIERHAAAVALFGWATGGQWAGYYASMYPEKVSALILLNSLYGANAPHPMLGHGSDMEDPAHPGQFNPASCGAYRFNSAASLLGGWDRSIPEQDKSTWRDPAVAKAYVDAALASDPTSISRTPPSFRSPCGALEDSFYLAIGRRIWDASLITAPTLILASERDFWSRPEDRQALLKDLTHAARVKVVVIPGATHFVHLDRPERGRKLLLDTVVAFLSAAAN
jgi:pimeloyl-ACP methyl ester carboxylesterase